MEKIPMTRFVTLALFVVLGAALYLYSVVYISQVFSPNQRIAMWLDPSAQARMRAVVWVEFRWFVSMLAASLPFAAVILWAFPRQWRSLAFGIPLLGLTVLILSSWDRNGSVVPLRQQIFMLFRVIEFVTVLPFVTWILA